MVHSILTTKVLATVSSRKLVTFTASTPSDQSTTGTGTSAAGQKRRSTSTQGSQTVKKRKGAERRRQEERDNSEEGEGQEEQDVDNGVCGICWDYECQGLRGNEVDWIGCEDKQKDSFGIPYCAPCNGWYHAKCLRITEAGDNWKCMACWTKKRLGGPEIFERMGGPIQMLKEKAKEYVGRMEGDVRRVFEVAREKGLKVPYADQSTGDDLLGMSEAWDWFEQLSQEIVPMFFSATVPNGYYPPDELSHATFKSAGTVHHSAIIYVKCDGPRQWHPVILVIQDKHIAKTSEDLGKGLFEGFYHLSTFVDKWMSLEDPLRPNPLTDHDNGSYIHSCGVPQRYRRIQRYGPGVPAQRLDKGIQMVFPGLDDHSPLVCAYQDLYTDTGIADRLAVINFVLNPTYYFQNRRLLETLSESVYNKKHGVAGFPLSHLRCNVIEERTYNHNSYGWNAHFMTGSFKENKVSFPSLGIDILHQPGTILFHLGNRLHTADTHIDFTKDNPRYVEPTANTRSTEPVQPKRIFDRSISYYRHEMEFDYQLYTYLSNHLLETQEQLIGDLRNPLIEPATFVANRLALRQRQGLAFRRHLPADWKGINETGDDEKV